MNLRDDLELDALAQTGSVQLAEDIGRIVQYVCDIMSNATGIDVSILAVDLDTGDERDL